MRPVDRGPWPTDAAGNPVQFKEYQDARAELLNRLGYFCSYCEMIITNVPAVEHVQPKSFAPGLKKDWENLLLACSYCNACKKKTAVALNDYVWPDLDNTLRAYVYSYGMVQISQGLNPDQERCASNTRRLVGLDRWLGGPREPTDEDKRWKHRSEAWDEAQEAKQDLAQVDTEAMRRRIAKLAKAKGFFSIWMTVFEDDADMRRRFIEIFPGTCKGCFDAKFKPQPRATGML